jgi:hypothetical protein
MRTIGSVRTGWVRIGNWVAVSVVAVALHAEPVCGQFRPPSGPRPQDIAVAKTQAEANSTAQFWTTGLVLVALAGGAYYFRAPLVALFKTYTDGSPRGPGTTDALPPTVGDHWDPARVAPANDAEETGPPGQATSTATQKPV